MTVTHSPVQSADGIVPPQGTHMAREWLLGRCGNAGKGSALGHGFCKHLSRHPERDRHRTRAFSLLP